MKITAMDLERASACEKEVERFRELFGEGPITITAALCMEHPEFDYNWAARHLLPAALRAKFDCRQAVLWTKRDHQEAVLWAEYGPVECARLRAECAVLWAELDRRCAVLFGTLAEKVP